VEVGVKRATVPDQVFSDLRQDILSGRLAPGERLPTQRTLALEYGVNIASVREAIKRLEQLRLVGSRQGDAVRVRDWRTSGGLEALAALKTSDDDLMAALFEARRLLLAEAGRLAAERRTDEQAAEIVNLAKAFADASDEQAALLIDWAFMAEIVEASANVVFKLIMNSVRELYLPSAAPFTRMLGKKRDPSAYERIAEAIGRRDADAAAAEIAALAEAQERRMVEG
jgi:DNA-binding FadR family transcriptional regulator